MKRISAALALLFLALSVSVAQTVQPRDTYQIGTKTIHVPVPAGLVNGYPRIPQVAANVKAFEDPEGRTLAMHITQTVAGKLLKGEAVDGLGFWAKTSAKNDMDNVNVTPKMFTEFVARVEKDFEAMVDAELPKAAERGKKSLEEFLGKRVDVGLTRPINLGTIDKRAGVFSVMLLTTIVQGRKNTPMLGVMAHVVVRERLLYINIYKEFTAEKDVDELRDFARKWADDIVAANR